MVKYQLSVNCGNEWAIHSFETPEKAYTVMTKEINDKRQELIDLGYKDISVDIDKSGASLSEDEHDVYCTWDIKKSTVYDSNKPCYARNNLVKLHVICEELTQNISNNNYDCIIQSKVSDDYLNTYEFNFMIQHIFGGTKIVCGTTEDGNIHDTYSFVIDLGVLEDENDIVSFAKSDKEYLVKQITHELINNGIALV